MSKDPEKETVQIVWEDGTTSGFRSIPRLKDRVDQLCRMIAKESHQAYPRSQFILRAIHHYSAYLYDSKTTEEFMEKALKKVVLEKPKEEVDDLANEEENEVLPEERPHEI